MSNDSGAGAVADNRFRAAYFGATPTTGGVTLQPARRIELLARFSGAFDLAELQPAGHACRVAHFALGIAEALKLTPIQRRRVLGTALLHDAGVAVRTAGGHLEGGAWVAERFGLDAGVQAAIRATHERWDGKGRPLALAGDVIPIEAMVVSAAHWASDHIEEPANPLKARATLQRANRNDLEGIVGPRVAEALFSTLRDDDIWISVWTADLAGIVAAAGSAESKPSHRQLEQAAMAMGDVIDAAVREPGRSRRVGRLSGALAKGLGLSTGFSRSIEIAGHLLDIGQLGVPRHVTEKPSILSVDEMEQMRRHPGLGSRMLEFAPGLSDVAAWIEAHHERPDGRGYPGMLTGDEIALPPRILAVADAFCALRAERPYRAALSSGEALAMVRAGAGRQFDGSVVAVLGAATEICERHWEADGALTTPVVERAEQRSVREA